MTYQSLWIKIIIIRLKWLAEVYISIIFANIIMIFYISVKTFFKPKFSIPWIICKRKFKKQAQALMKLNLNGEGRFLK